MEGDGGKSSKGCSSKTSSDDHGSADQVADDASSGRFYECIFCKRGFPTAQALGGHMNIHRKDRAKMSRQANTTTIPSSASKPEGDHDVFDTHRGSYGYYNNQYQQSLKNYDSMLILPASSPSIGKEEYLRPRELSLFCTEDHLGLGLRARGDGRHPVLGRGEARERVKEGDIDLELRLGL